MSGVELEDAQVIAECGCKAIFAVRPDKFTGIIYCPLHKNAGKLLEACQTASFAIKLCLNKELAQYADSWSNLKRSIDAAVREAEGG